MSSPSKHSVSFYILDPDYLFDLEDILEGEFPEVDFKRTESIQTADIVFADNVSPLSESSKNNRRFVIFTEIDDVIPALAARLTSGALHIPSDTSRQMVLSGLHDFNENFEKLRVSTQKSLSAESLGDVSEGSESSVVSLHPAQMSRFASPIKKVLDRRIERGYQRHIDGYLAVSPLVSPEGYPAQAAFQADSSIPVKERMNVLRANIGSREADLNAVGVKVSPTSMEYSQINVGMPFFGGLERKAKSLSSPTRKFEKYAKFAAEEMLLPMALAHKVRDISSDEVRVGVKTYGFQGAPLCSYSHATRQTFWSIMQRSKEGIFHFENAHLPSIIGLRRQDNPSMKKRAAFLPSPDGTVVRGRVYDGDELEGKALPSFSMYPEFSSSPLKDEGKWGARVRHVDNVASIQNDALVTIPAFIAKYKDEHYKLVFQQAPEVFEMMIPGTSAFEEFWTEGWETQQWVRDSAKERGISSLPALLQKMKDLGEYPFCGDIANFDGNMTWPLMVPGLGPLMSERAFKLAKNIEESSVIGAYTGADGEIVYYLVDKKDPVLGDKTAELASHLNSGVGVTSPVGRTSVPGMLMEICSDAFGIPEHIMDARPAVKRVKGEFVRSKFSFMPAFMNCAGDDHTTKMLVIWLVTGIHPAECKIMYRKACEAYKMMEIAEENPPMNAGTLLHLCEKDGRLLNFSLSPNRMIAGNLFPERGRSSVGLFDSTDLYVNSAIGTPAEEAMLVARDVIVSSVMGFEDEDHLLELRTFEMDAMMADPDLAAPVETLAAYLNVPANSLEWSYSYEELLELGVPLEILDEFKRPIPVDLTTGPFKFINQKTVEALASEIVLPKEN